MSQHVTSSNKSEEIKKDSYQSVWMAHWMRTDFDNENQTTTQIASKPSKQIEEIQTLKENVRGVNGPRLLLLQKESSSHLLSRLQEAGKQITPWVEISMANNKMKEADAFLSDGSASGSGIIMSPHHHLNDQCGQIKQSVTEPPPFHSPNSSSMNNFPSFRQLKLPSYHGELTRLEMFHHGYSSIRKLPHRIIGANVDSIAGSSSGCFPIFSNSKYHKEDVLKNVSSTSPFLRHGQQGVKIQSLTSSTDSQGNRYHQDSKDSQGNASSAETDAMDMDMDAFTERCHNSGVNQSSFVKALKSNTMQFSGDRPRTEMKNSLINSEFPDTNLEFSSANNKIEGAGTSFSKTQSLDMDMLQAYPARTNNSISSPSLSILMKADPTVRWAKRLKSSATDTRGFEEVSRNEMKRPSDKFTSSESLGVNHKGKNSKSDKGNGFEIKNGSSSKVGIQRGKDLLLSQSWIQRWVRNEGGSGEKQLEALVLCEPQSSKLVLDDLQKKQFPSIAAMALMGRAMNGFQPCELQNRGPFVVWN